MVKFLGHIYISVLLSLFQKNQSPTNGHWRDTSQEKMVQPYAEIYSNIELPKRLWLLELLLMPWVKLLSRRQNRQDLKGKVSGIYYPID